MGEIVFNPMAMIFALITYVLVNHFLIKTVNDIQDAPSEPDARVLIIKLIIIVILVMIFGLLCLIYSFNNLRLWFLR